MRIDLGGNIGPPRVHRWDPSIIDNAIVVVVVVMVVVVVVIMGIMMDILVTALEYIQQVDFVAR